MYINTDDYGLVFSGGGGKGAFEIGVWKALREMKRYPIGAVSGTSVGALNAALYATGDYEKAEELWENISLFKVLAPKFNLMKNAAFQLMIPGNPFLGMLVNHVGIMAACSMFNDYLTERSGLFSRDGLVRMIEESRVLDQLPKSTIPCFATCFNISKCRTQSFLLNEERGERISDILQASSSIPAVFPLVELDQNYYCDGGIPFFGDNIPIQPLYDVGFRKFIVVHLRNPRQDERDKMKRRFEDARFIHIYADFEDNLPSKTFDFSSDNATDRIMTGYRKMRYVTETETEPDLESYIFEKLVWLYFDYNVYGPWEMIKRIGKKESQRFI